MKKYLLKDDDLLYYMNVVLVSRYLHVAKSTIYKWVENGFIPHRKLRKKVLFVKKDIDHWVENNGETVNDLPQIPKFQAKVTEHVPEGTNYTVYVKEHKPEHHHVTVEYRKAG
jgi:excisionase family DNA binding protein